ncbi:MAG: amidohydrolase family protein, partial [Anaerolineae bacterium]|nr:amidohydrolase family protein [Anaerolineae bacterium]
AFEEEWKGSLEVGKLADFVVLAQNPLEVPQSDLKDIEVVMTMKEGGLTYQK